MTDALYCIGGLNERFADLIHTDDVGDGRTAEEVISNIKDKLNAIKD